MTNFSSNPAEPRQPTNWEDEGEHDDFKPLTREQAQQWRQRQPAQSPWRVVVWQLALWVVVTLLAVVVSGQRPVVLSVAYGGLCVLLPTALMAYGLTASGLSRWVSRGLPGFPWRVCFFGKGSKSCSLLPSCGWRPAWSPISIGWPWWPAW